MQQRFSALFVFSKNILLFVAITLLGGCSGLSYYSQSISGQLELLAKKRRIDLVLEDQQTPDAIKQKLRLVENIRDFAEQELLLPAQGSYQEYSDLGRPYAVWNIFATPELSLEPVQWCFPIVGCLSYRGYFDKAQAQQFATQLRVKGMDVYMAGITAFSTLGWFNDPVMNTMLNRDDHELAKLLFHELSHQKVYVKNDTAFNEAFADAVAIIGMERWAEMLGIEQQSFYLESERERQFSELVLKHREELESLYSTVVSNEKKRSQKSNIIAKLRQAYQGLRASWNGYAGFDVWMNGPINNAKLSAVATYQYFVSDFIAIYTKTGNDLKSFYSIAEQLAACKRASRHHLLQKHATLISC